MSKKTVDDYLNDGIYGSKRPKEGERRKYLGTLRERIILQLTIGEVMTDAGINKLDEMMREHKDAKLLINGEVSYRFLSEEKKVANKHNIPYTVITNEEADTDVGAVLTCDYAIHKEDIFLHVNDEEKKQEESKQKSSSFISKIKELFNTSS